MAEDAAVEIVKVELADAPLGVTDAGEKLQLVCAGNPKQESETELSKPFSGVRFIVKVAVLPRLIVELWGEALTEKSGGFPPPFVAKEILTTKALRVPFNDPWRAFLVGKSAELVPPASKTLPNESMAILVPV